MEKINSLSTQLVKCCFCDFLKVNLYYYFKYFFSFILLCIACFWFEEYCALFNIIILELSIIYKLLNMQFYVIWKMAVCNSCNYIENCKGKLL